MIPEFLLNRINTNYDNESSNLITKGYEYTRPLTIRVNTLKIELPTIINYLKTNNIEYKEVSWSPNALIILNRREEDLRATDIYKDGKIYFQSLSSQLPPLFVNPHADENILDMAAAPGGKTTELQSLSNNTSLVTAVEKNKIRYERLEYNINKLGAKKINIIKKDARLLDDYFSFDKIMLDAPCSGSGTLNINNMSEFNEELITRSIETQKQLITKAFKLLKKDGVLTYSTCSILKEENEEVVKYLLDNNSNAEIIHLDLSNYQGLPILKNSIPGTLTLYPNEYYEGFFIAQIKKTK
jgi:NOL1/NOP2/sun family putative RNA methylase